MAIKNTLEEIEDQRLEDLEEKLLETASLDFYKNNPDADFDNDEEEDEVIVKHLNENRKELTVEFGRNVQSGTMYCHEALENASNVMSDCHALAEEPSILSNPEWYKMASEAGTILFNLYQAIGADHLEAIPDNLVEMIEEQKKNKKSNE